MARVSLLDFPPAAGALLCVALDKAVSRAVDRTPIGGEEAGARGSLVAGFRCPPVWPRSENLDGDPFTRNEARPQVLELVRVFVVAIRRAVGLLSDPELVQVRLESDEIRLIPGRPVPRGRDSGDDAHDGEHGQELHQ